MDAPVETPTVQPRNYFRTARIVWGLLFGACESTVPQPARVPNFWKRAVFKNHKGDNHERNAQ
ncbi:MAG: hypothetical protein LV473_17030 [Nitrospira sp.]|nr:hypothetical protein [Nitrospira sp.]